VSAQRLFRFQRGWFFLTGSDIDFDALLADALGVSVETLEDAYQQAFQARIDQAVADGKLTETEADLIRGRRRCSRMMLSGLR
jgi:hypothetical protein